MTTPHKPENEALVECFVLPYDDAGWPLADLDIVDRDHMGVGLFRCRKCAALTDKPDDHANWHYPGGLIRSGVQEENR